MFKGMVKGKTEDNKFSAAQEHKIIFAFEMVENIVEKGENACYQHIVHSPQCFEKPSFMGIKTLDCLIKINSQIFALVSLYKTQG